MDTHGHERVALSVAWGRMGRMSEESLPHEDRGEHPDALPAYAERVLDVA